MSRKVKVSPRIVSNIARTYQSTSRIFMEYVDNSLDSAEKIFEDNGRKYPDKISINVRIDSKNKTVIFEDNCLGMDLGNLIRIIENIGDSNKKSDFITNGQFGFGIHAYAACAEQLEVTSLRENAENAWRINIDREAYTEDGEIPDEIIISRSNFPFISGTVVKISDFDNNWWKEVNPEIIAGEVERHFEQLLARENLEIKIYWDDEEMICKTFDYDEHLGNKIEKELKELEIKKHSRSTVNGDITSKLPINMPVKISLKITEYVIPDKRPIFTNKGRRIEEVQNIKSFRNKSKYKTSIWGHNNLTGYIEVAGLLEPTLPRDDFQKSRNRDMVYEEILKIEDEINETLKQINKQTEDASMSKFEDLLSKTLAKLAFTDRLRFRNEYVSGNDIGLKKDEGSNSILNIKKGGGNGKTETETSATEKIPVIETDDDAEESGKEKKRSGFRIKFKEREAKKADGTLIRSEFIEGDSINIYKNHPDFSQRIKRKRQGEMIISDRLISYIATEIAIHYKDKFYSTRGKQPEVQAVLNERKELFADMTSFIYLYEEALQPYVGFNLNTLEAETDE